MESFRYTAINPARERISGEVRAKDAESGIKALQAEGHTVVLFQSAAVAAARPSKLGDRLLLLFDKIRHRVPLENLVFFTRQLSTMFSAGMTLERSVDVLARGERHEKLRAILTSVHGDLRKGTALSEALARHPAIFDRLYVALIKSGESGGTLGRILDELAIHLEKTEDIRRKVASALYYPVFVLGFLFVASAVLILKVAPMFDKVYKSFGADLPAATRALMNTSDFILAHLFLAVLALLTLIGAVVVFSQTDTGRGLFHAFQLRVPVLGKLTRHSYMARFARTFSLLLSSSVPVLDSLGLTAQALTNVVIEKGILAARQGILQGRKIFAAFQETAVFPSLLLQLMATGEETGELDRLLLKAAEFYEKEVDAMISKITSILEPMLIILMALVVGTLVVVIYLPIFYLGMAIRRGMH